MWKLPGEPIAVVVSWKVSLPVEGLQQDDL